MENDYEVRYVWDEAAERRGFEDALAVLDEAEAHECGRLTGIVYPAQIDTCSTDVLVDAHAESVARNRPFTTHAAQSVIEFREIIHRHGKTPIQWAHAIGILGENTILGHALFTDEHSWTPWPTGSDISILAETGTSVAHCPTPFSRYGHVLENFGRYRGAGVRMGLGTDVTPQNLIEEMRTAVITARIAAGDVGAVTAADVFEAATIGGAGALMRNDLGRIAPGAKADIVLLDTRHPLMMPVHDLLRSLVYSAAERAVRDVYVDGLQVVKDRKVTTLDHMGALERLTEAQARMLRDAPNRDYLGRQADEIVPLSLERR
jgi:cytosine/adenosine deaminase-related metal-dependent hydrolase